ncbi:MAG: hypothetical protein V7752_03235 [Halopseudomonas sp.]
MTRDEEFSDIPELGPARDALDQADIPTLKKTTDAAAKSHPVEVSAPQAVSQNRDNRLMSWLVLLLMVVMGAGGYWGMGHISQLQKQLILSNQRLTDLEGLINATDESANKSGAALQAQIKKYLQDSEKRLKHVDSELAKLWTVAYQRNKPKIAEIDKTVAGLDKTLGSLGKQSAQQAKVLEKTQAELGKANVGLKSLDQGLVSQQSDMKELGAQLQMRDQANQELDTLQDSQLLQVEQQLKAIQENPPVPDALALSVKEHEQAIAAINSFRKQANSEMLRLADQIKQLQRSVKANSAPVTASPAPKAQ